MAGSRRWHAADDVMIQAGIRQESDHREKLSALVELLLGMLQLRPQGGRNRMFGPEVFPFAVRITYRLFDFGLIAVIEG
jgi:hypothetical protein